MKIAIASSKQDTSSEVNLQAGRAPYYLIFDDEKSLLESIKNPFVIGGGGAGYGVAKMFSDRKVDLAIAGEFGQNMENALAEKGIKYDKMRGSVKEVLDKLISG